MRADTREVRPRGPQTCDVWERSVCVLGGRHVGKQLRFSRQRVCPCKRWDRCRGVNLWMHEFRVWTVGASMMVLTECQRLAEQEELVGGDPVVKMMSIWLREMKPGRMRCVPMCCAMCPLAVIEVGMRVYGERMVRCDRQKVMGPSRESRRLFLEESEGLLAFRGPAQSQSDSSTAALSLAVTDSTNSAQAISLQVTGMFRLRAERASEPSRTKTFFSSCLSTPHPERASLSVALS